MKFSVGLMIILTQLIQQRSAMAQSILRGSVKNGREAKAGGQQMRTSKNDGRTGANIPPTSKGPKGKDKDRDDPIVSVQQCLYDWEATAEELSLRKAAWEKFMAANDPGCYSMTVERGCFCPVQYRGPFNVTIHYDESISPEGFDLMSMDGLFDMVYEECVESCPNVGAASCQIEYAPESEGSYIRSIVIDKNYEQADEEIRLAISNLSLCPTVGDALDEEGMNSTVDEAPEGITVGEPYPGFMNETMDDPVLVESCQYDWLAASQELRRNRKKWNMFEENLTGCYTMTIERSCRCLEEYRGPFTVKVKDNKVASPKGVDVMAMDSYFQMVQAECIHGCPESGAAFCRIEYAPESEGSYISSIYIDKSYEMADEEIILTITNLTRCE